MPEPDQDIYGDFERLQASVKSGTCIAIIGSGCSLPYFMSWQALVDKLLDDCKVPHCDRTDADLAVLADLARAHNESVYFRTVHDEFGRSVNDQTVLYRYILIANCNFKYYITLNYDSALEQALQLRHKTKERWIYPNIGDPHNADIVYIHGKIPESGRKFVLTASDFARAYGDVNSESDRTYSIGEDDFNTFDFLKRTFLQNDICFIGCKPSEPSMLRVLGACRRIFASTRNRDHPQCVKRRPPNWYWLVPSDEQAACVDAAKQTGVNIIEYSNIDKSHKELYTMLDAMQERALIQTGSALGVPMDIRAGLYDDERQVIGRKGAQ